MMNGFFRSTISVLLGLAFLWPTAASAQSAPSDPDYAIIAGVLLSTVGSVVCCGVNGHKLAHGSPSTIGGIFGVVFGVSTMALLGAAEAWGDMDVDDAGMLLFGSVSLASTVLGGWSLLEARSSQAAPQTKGLSARPFVTVKRNARDCGIGVCFEY